MSAASDLLLDLAHGIAGQLSAFHDEKAFLDAVASNVKAFGLVMIACGLSREVADAHMRRFAIETEREVFRLLDQPFDEAAANAATMPSPTSSHH